MKNPVAHNFPSRCDSLRRHFRQSITTKVRINPPCEKTVKNASGKSRLKNFADGANSRSVWIVCPADDGNRPGKDSSKTGWIVRYLKKTRPNFAICGTTV